MKNKNQFGTFAGVFTPSILTILGVIMFMNAGTVVGYAGLLGGLAILIMGKSITSLTSLSISAITSNMDVKGGGSYYLITRSLGSELGGAIGISLYMALALSVPFYIIGLVDALKGFESINPFLAEYYMEICLGFALVFFIITYVGAWIALKVQFLILLILGTSILTFMVSLAWHFDTSRFIGNLSPCPAGLPGNMSFWTLFAIYFPAVTGITAGVSMSGDLKEPSKSIPAGTLAAVGIGFLIYAFQMILMAGGIDRVAEEGIPSLINTPYFALKNSAGKFGLLVAFGAIAATASSTLGSFVGAPRIMQAISRDRIFVFLNAFGKGAIKGDEPRRALWLTFVITVITLIVATKTSENALNSVAAILTMFFLASYGTVNASAFVEAFGKNPSFRPKFRFFHWGTALAGMVGCMITAFLINWIAALSAAVIISLLYAYLANRHMKATFGDARRGFVFTRARNAILKLSRMPADAKNWRPNIVVLSGNPETRYTLVQYAIWMEAGRGLITLVNFIVGDIGKTGDERRKQEKELAKFIEAHNFPAIAEVNVTPDFERTLSIFLQSHSLQPIRPNVLMIGWTGDESRVSAFITNLNIAYEIDMSLIVLLDRGLPEFEKPLRIDIWWRGMQNGSLMLILAHLITQTDEWEDTEIRILRVVASELERYSAEKELLKIVEHGRMKATCEAIVSDRTFSDILHEQSGDASVVFLGLRLPAVNDAKKFHETYEQLLDKLPTTIMVCSTGETDLYA